MPKTMSSHELARRLLELDDVPVITVEGEAIKSADNDTYDESEDDDLPCVCLETEPWL
jgi:hypothetical protein